MKQYLEFNFGETLIDYERIYQRFKKKEFSRKELHEFIPNVSYSSISQVITTLSIRYPLYSPRRGVYKFLSDDDFK